MPKLSEINFEDRSSKAAKELVERLKGAGFNDPAPIQRAFEAFADVDPLQYAYEDAGVAVRDRLLECLRAESSLLGREDLVLQVLLGMQDGYGDLFGAIALNAAMPGPTIPPEDLPPEPREWGRGKPLELWYFDPDDIIQDEDDGIEVKDTSFQNPFVVKVVVAGVSKTIALPAYVGWVILSAFAVAILGGNRTSFLKAFMHGLRKLGRGLKKAGREIKRVLKDIF